MSMRHVPARTAVQTAAQADLVQDKAGADKAVGGDPSDHHCPGYFEAWTVRLEPGTTKNRDGRLIYLTPELHSLLQEQRAATRTLERQAGRVIPWVFHYRGEPMKDFRAAWQGACRRAGQPGRLFHDLRRTAVRNMVRAGIPERVLMQISGHKTRAIFDRYHIVSEGDLREAAQRLGTANVMGTKTGTIGEMKPQGGIG
jgi:integrase